MSDQQLPSWVVERCIRALMRRMGLDPDMEIPEQGGSNPAWSFHYNSMEAALAEFLAIIEERGLRVVPNTIPFVTVPPLAELLEKPDAD